MRVRTRAVKRILPMLQCRERQRPALSSQQTLCRHERTIRSPVQARALQRLGQGLSFRQRLPDSGRRQSLRPVTVRHRAPPPRQSAAGENPQYACGQRRGRMRRSGRPLGRQHVQYDARTGLPKRRTVRALPCRARIHNPVGFVTNLTAERVRLRSGAESRQQRALQCARIQLNLPSDSSFSVESTFMRRPVRRVWAHDEKSLNRHRQFTQLGACVE